MNRRCMVGGLLMVMMLVFAVFLVSAQDGNKWVEYGDNAIFGQGVGGPKAYYPSVLYDSDAFSDHGGADEYKMWYGTSGGRTGLATSEDGIVWSDHGVVMNKGYHSTVEYFPAGFSGTNSGSDPSGDTMYYRMWYWNPSHIYEVAAIGYTESSDGINWYNNQPCQNGTVPIVSSGDPWWNRGSYGPSDVLYNPNASNTGTDWTYTMYYDGTTGGTESTGVGFSSDGITWMGFDSNGDNKADPVLSGTYVSGDWDYNYAGRATILQKADGSYEMWYSGGKDALNHGIGYALSPDGKYWVRDEDNPLFYIDDSVPWRSKRTYCPMVVYDPDEGIYKMWFAGKDATGNYSIGYAIGGPIPTNVWVDDDWDAMPAASRAEHGRYMGYNAFAAVQKGIDAVAGTNAHTVSVREGTYNAPILIDKAVSVVRDSGAVSAPILNGNVNINGNGVLIGLPLQGLRFNGNLMIGAGIDAATSRINWCDFYGEMTNNGTGTFNAKYNYWGTQDEAAVAGRTFGDIDYQPFLPKDADSSYADVQELLAAGVASDLDSAVRQLWQVMQLGQSVDTFINYQDIGGAGAFRTVRPEDLITIGEAAGGGGAVETTFGDTYIVGDVIDGQLTVTDRATGELITNAAVTLSLLGPDGSKTVVLWGSAYYDADAEVYVFSIDTTTLTAGIYEFIFQTDTGDSKMVSIKLQES